MNIYPHVCIVVCDNEEEQKTLDKKLIDKDLEGDGSIRIQVSSTPRVIINIVGFRKPVDLNFLDKQEDDHG